MIPVMHFLRKKFSFSSFGFPSENEFSSSCDVHRKYGYILLSVMKPMTFSGLKSLLQYYHLITAYKYVKQLKKRIPYVKVKMSLCLPCHL